MQMHPYFTEIPLRSFEAMAFEVNLSEVLLALIVDPHEAEDVARTIREIQATRIELAFDSEIIDAPITLAEFQNLPSKHAFEQLKITLAQWVMTTESASDALRVLTVWDRRFGVWCACAVAREALRYVPAVEQRPLRAIEAAEAWVTGKATIETVADAADRAAAYAAAYAADAAYAAYISSYVNYAAAARAAEAARAAADAAVDAVYAAAYAALANARASASADDAARAAANAKANTVEDAAWVDIHAAELIRLREVVANACLSFPG